MTIRFFGIGQPWHDDALTEVCLDPRLGDILRWLADAGHEVSLSRYRGHPTVILRNEQLRPGKAFRADTWHAAAARAIQYATTPTT